LREHQQLDKSFSEGFPGLFGFFLASAFFEAFFFAFFCAFSGLPVASPFSGLFQLRAFRLLRAFL
jgi:hypothetical protein